MGTTRGHHLGHVWGIIWGISGACIGHHLGYVLGIIWVMSGASSGACLVQSIPALVGIPGFYKTNQYWLSFSSIQGGWMSTKVSQFSHLGATTQQTSIFLKIQIICRVWTTGTCLGVCHTSKYFTYQRSTKTNLKPWFQSRVVECHSRCFDCLIRGLHCAGGLLPTLARFIYILIIWFQFSSIQGGQMSH